jgi:hypothetical protein
MAGAGDAGRAGDGAVAELAEAVEPGCERPGQCCPQGGAGRFQSESMPAGPGWLRRLAPLAATQAAISASGPPGRLCSMMSATAVPKAATGASCRR